MTPMPNSNGRLLFLGGAAAGGADGIAGAAGIVGGAGTLGAAIAGRVPNAAGGADAFGAGGCPAV